MHLDRYCVALGTKHLRASAPDMATQTGVHQESTLPGRPAVARECILIVNVCILVIYGDMAARTPEASVAGGELVNDGASTKFSGISSI